VSSRSNPGGGKGRVLDSLLRAESVVVIGASDDPEKVGGRALLFLLRHGYAGPISAVNPNRKEIQGIPVAASIRDIPENIDLALICLPAAACPNALDECGERGVKAAVVFSGGFSEVGAEGEELEKRLVAIARKWDITLCGPNTVGFVNLGKNLPATFAAPLADLPATQDGTISFIAQSGAFGTFLYSWAMGRQLPLRQFVSIGNAPLLGISEITADLIADEKVRALGVHMEGIKDGHRLVPILREALHASKPICILKTGHTDVGQRAVTTHTGALAGADEVYAGAFDQTGAVRVQDALQMLDFLDLANQMRAVPAGSRVGLVSTSGGVGVWAADILAEMGASLPEFSDCTTSRLAKTLPAFGSSRNPIDMTGQILSHPQMVGECLAAVLADPGIDVALLIFAYQHLNGSRIAADIIAAAQASAKPTVIVWMFAQREHFSSLQQAGLPVFEDPSRTVPALARYLRWGAAHTVSGHADVVPKDELVEPLPRPRDLDASGVVSEADAKSMLADFGIAAPPGGAAASRAEAERIAAHAGYPVVLKGLLPGAIHKSTLGLVVLDVRSAAQLRREFDALRARMAALGGPASGAPVLVEAYTPAANEFILGARTDPSFGKVIMLGSGGTAAEAIRDVRVRTLPLSPHDIASLIRDTRAGQYLAAHGSDELVPALADAIGAFQRLVAATAEWAESIEINPLAFRRDGRGLIALDAVILASPVDSSGPARPIRPDRGESR
jgi:acetate---CoA ligase (ADP-forming)